MVDDRMSVEGRSDVEKIVWAGLFVPGVNGRRGLPYVLVGKPGTAKTSSAAQLARRAGLHFRSVVASLRDPSDFLGLGVPSRMPLTPATQHLDPDGGSDMLVMRYAPAEFAVDVATRRRSLLMLDEVNTTAPSVQAALLRLLFEGVCGELTLPPEVRMILAMNATEDAAGGWDIAPPLANRIGWLAWPAPEVSRFSEFLMQGGALPEPLDCVALEREVDRRWPEAWANAVGVVTGFLRKMGDGKLLAMPPSGSPAASSAWPSPRTWELATRAYAGGRVFALSPDQVGASLAAFVGAGAASELRNWVRTADLPDPAEFLDGKVDFVHSARLDRTAAVLSAATALVVNSPADVPEDVRRARVGRLWAFHGTLAEAAPDLSFGSVAALCNARLTLGQPNAYPVLARLEPIMAASGFNPARWQS